MSTSIVDIATQLNLSKSTVSKALNGYSDVSDATRQRVLQKAEELGYQPSALARGLRRGKTDKIGLFLNTTLEYVVDYLSGIMPGAVRKAQELGKNLIIYTIIDNDPAQLLQVCRAGEIDGIILFSTHYDVDTIETLLKDEIPFVVMGREIIDPRVSYVIPDYYQGSYKITKYLIEQGHKRIAFTTRPELTTANDSRLAGYFDCLAHFNIEIDDELIVETRLEPNSGIEPTRLLMSLAQPPTAICAFHDLVAVDVIQVIQDMGLSVPDDVAVFGFDGLRAGFMTIPHISTARQPLEQIGTQVIEIVNAQISNIEYPVQKRVLPVHLELRGSA